MIGYHKSSDKKERKPVRKESDKDPTEREETRKMVVSLYHVKMNVPLLKANSAKEYVKWIPQMDAYSVYKEFSEVMKATKYAKLPENEKEFEPDDDETEIDLKHTEDEEEALLKNRMAVTAFTMAFRECSDAYTMNMVIASKTKNWPSGQS